MAYGIYKSGSVEEGALASNSISNAKMKDDAVDSAEIADGAVDTVHIADANVTLAKIQNIAANTVLVRDANSSGVVSAKAVANTEILIGDGTGFTAAALSGDVTMTNAGAVSLAGAQTNITSIINSSLAKIGTNASQEYITFGTANEVNTFVNNTERLSVTDSGVDVTGAMTISGDLTVSGTTTTVKKIEISTANGVIFEGSTADASETTLIASDPSADRTITLPDLSGHVALLADASTAASSAVTAAEFALLDGGSTVGTTAVAGGDGILTNDNGTMRQTTVDTFDTYLAQTTKTLTNKTMTAPVLNSPTVGTAILPASADGAALGSASAEWADLYLADGGIIYMGDDQDVKITHDADAGITLSTVGDGGSGPKAILNLHYDSASPADDDMCGAIKFKGDDDGGNVTSYAEITGVSKDVTDGTEDGALSFDVLINGSPVGLMDISKTAAGVVTIKDGAYDFNVASHDGTNGLKLAGTLVTATAAELSLLNGIADHSITRDADSIVFYDAGTSKFRRDSMADVVAAMAGAGSTATDGQLNVIAGNGITVNANDVAVSAAQTTITSIFATDLKIGEDDQTKIDFEDANKINFYVNNVKEIVLEENELSPGTNDGIALGSAAMGWSDLYLADGGQILLGNDQDVKLTHEADSGMTLSTAGDGGSGPKAILALHYDSATPADNDMCGELRFQGDDDGGTKTTYAAITGVSKDVTDSTEDGALVMEVILNGSPVGILDICKTTASTVTLKDGAYDLDIASHDGSNGLKLAGTLVTSTAAELNIMDGGTAASSTTLADADRVVVNDNGTMKQVALTDFEVYFESALDTLNNVTSASSLATVGTISSGTWQGGVIASAYLDADTAHLSGTQTFSGAKTFSAAAQFSNTLTVGEDDTGYDVKFFGATTGKYMEWDESKDLVTVSGATRLVSPSALAAAGSSVSDAAQIPATASLQILSSDSSSKGWKLPAAATVGAGHMIYLINSSSTAAKLYGEDAAAVIDGSASIDVPASAGMILVCTDATNGAEKWFII